MTKNLQHYGIKGMQWGVRRKRSSKTGRVESEDSRKAKVIGKKKLSEMSNEELKVLTTRLQLEKQYKDLTKKEKSNAQKIAQELLANEAKRQAQKLVAVQGDKAVQQVAKMIDIYKATKANDPFPKTEPFRSTSSYKFKKKP